MLTAHLNVQTVVQDIAGTLEAVGCYRWRDEAVCRAVPSYGPGWRMKIVISGGTDGRVNVFRIIASAPDGSVIDKRLRLQDYLQIVAATNFKQRVRKTLEYFHADRLNYAVAGTPNRLEYDQGFFVKNGDGAADFKPIAHLYKTQVYAMARYFDLPEQICRAEPTTDTYSLEQGQDEFFFALPYRQMDLALWGRDRGITPEAMAAELGFSVERMRAIYADIDAKRRNARYLHAPALLMRPLSGRQD
ncbi:MAG: NAD(+) synthase [Steroidobacteraceae bacterium]